MPALKVSRVSLKTAILRKQVFGIGGNIAIHEFVIVNVSPS
jgi:hypothetical protein